MACWRAWPFFARADDLIRLAPRPECAAAARRMSPQEIALRAGGDWIIVRREPMFRAAFSAVFHVTAESADSSG